MTSNTPTCKNYWLSAFQCPSTDPAGNKKLLSSCGTNTMSVITIRYPFLQCLTSWLPFHNNECTMKTYMVGSQIHYTYSFTILVHNILKSKHVQCINCVINFLSKGCGWDSASCTSSHISIFPNYDNFLACSCCSDLVTMVLVTMVLLVVK